MNDEQREATELIEEICRQSQEDMRLSDYELGAALRRFGQAMSRDGEDFLTAGLPLARYLMSDAEIGIAERREIALAVLGTDRKPRGRAALHPHHPDVVPVARRFRELIAEGCPRDTAVFQIAGEFTITERTVHNRLKIVFEREKAEVEARRRVGWEKKLDP